MKREGVKGEKKMKSSPSTRTYYIHYPTSLLYASRIGTSKLNSAASASPNSSGEKNKKMVEGDI